MAPRTALVALAACAVAAAAPTSWVHPGVLVSGSQLDYIKAQIAAGAEPFASAYAKALKSHYSALDWTPMGPPASGVIECGSYSKPDYGCTDETDDGAAAYLQALLYHLNGTQQYALNAIRIMNGYSAVTKYNNSNAPLQAGWGAGKWARAAELIRHSDAAALWPAAAQDAFVAFLTNVSLPLYRDGLCENGNWELTGIEAMFAIAALTEDGALFDAATALWRSRVPAYLYIASDGPAPVPVPHRPCRGVPSWYNQSVYNSSTSGICQETCRDAGHTQMGMAAMMNGAQTAFIQGLDLFHDQGGSDAAARLAAALEFHSNFLLGAPVPSYVCNGNGIVGIGSTAPTFEHGYLHISTLGGVPLPRTLAHLQTQVRALPDPVNALMMVYETLTAGGAPSS